MNPVNIIENSLNEFKSQILNYHLAFEKKKIHIKVKVESLRDEIIIQRSTQLLDKLNRIEKEYETTLNTFIEKQSEIEEQIEQNKQIFKSLNKKSPVPSDSNQYSIVISNLNAAISKLNTAQNQLEELEFDYKFESNSQILFSTKVII